MPTFREDIKLGSKVPLMKTDDINDLAVTTAKLADASVTTVKIADSAVTTHKLDDESVTNEKIAVGAVHTENIENGAVTTKEISDSAVTTPKIADSAVTTEKINNASVTTEKINDLAVTHEKLSEKVENMLQSSIESVEYLQEYTDIDNVGEVRHVMVCLRNNQNDGSYFDKVTNFSLNTATTTRDGLMAGEDKQQLDAHEADLKAIHKVTDNTDTNYLRRDGRFAMTGRLSMGDNAITDVTGLRKMSPGGSYIVFDKDGYDIAFGSSDNGGSGDGEFEDITRGGFSSSGFYANGFYTTEQSYYGLLGNNGTVLQSMSDTEIASVANAVFNS